MENLAKCMPLTKLLVPGPHVTSAVAGAKVAGAAGCPSDGPPRGVSVTFVSFTSVRDAHSQERDA